MKPTAPAPAKLTIQLKRPYALFALSSLFFAVCGAVMARTAITNDRGVIINGIIHLGPDGADIFYALLTLFSVGFVVIGLWAMVGLSRLEHFRLVLGKTTLKMPPDRYFKRTGEVSIPLREIRAIETQPASAPRALVIHTSKGRFGLDKRVLPSAWTIPDLADTITTRVRALAELAEKESA